MDTPPGENIMLTSKDLGSIAFVILEYDVTDKNSYENLEAFIENFNNNCKNEVRHLYIVGNKIDKQAR